MKQSYTEIDKLLLPVLSGDENAWNTFYGSPAKGNFHYSSVEDSLYYWNGATWKKLADTAIAGDYLARDGSQGITGDWDMVSGAYNFFFPNEGNAIFSLRNDADASVGIGTANAKTVWSAYSYKSPDVNSSFVGAVAGGFYIQYLQALSGFIHILYISPDSASPSDMIFFRGHEGFTGPLVNTGAIIRYGRRNNQDSFLDGTYRFFSFTAGLYVNALHSAQATFNQYEVPFPFEAVNASSYANGGGTDLTKAGIHIASADADTADFYADGWGIEGIGNTALPYLYLNRLIKKIVRTPTAFWVGEDGGGNLLKMTNSKITWTPTTLRGDLLAFPQGAYGVATGNALPYGYFSGVPQVFLKSLLDMSKNLDITFTYSGSDVSSIAITGDVAGSVAYTYNLDGTVATETRTFYGITQTLTYTYSNGNCTRIQVA